MEDIYEAQTMPLQLCHNCCKKGLAGDRFCRRCGERQTFHINHKETRIASDLKTSPLAEKDSYHKVSGSLLKAVTASVSARAFEQINKRAAKNLVFILVSIPVWLLIILFSPLDAYIAARDVASQFVRH